MTCWVLFDETSAVLDFGLALAEVSGQLALAVVAATLITYLTKGIAGDLP